jgi:branched-chain amino acid transport system ATP-binding protein
MEGVTAGYTMDIDILKNLSLSVKEGSVTGLIGLNGSGKSTVMKTIYGFLRPREGRITFKGADISALAPHEMAKLGLWMIPQDNGLFAQFSVEENLRLPIETRRAMGEDISRSEIERRVGDALSRFSHLRDKRRDRATMLSGGQRKILEFAIAYVQKPIFCMIDEPSIGLAPKVAEEIFQYISSIASESTTVLLVDHNIRKVIEVSSFIYVITLGKVTAAGTQEAFKGNLHDEVQQWLGLRF